MNTEADMDYKELIRRLVECDQWDEAIRNDELSLALEDAADAIETLLAERDAAVEDLTKICEDNPDVCQYCKHMPYTGKHDPCIGWKWRGPQKGENNDQAKL